MNFKEELRKQYKSLSDFQIDVIAEIAKTWALEMVGENEDTWEGYSQDKNEMIVWKNQARIEIRDRIKEVCK